MLPAMSRYLCARGCVLLPILFFVATLRAQPTARAWAEQLAGHPLYLRDAWSEDKIKFNAAGEPTIEAHHGALTLSGIDITDVKVSGDQMQLRGQRVVLVTPAPGQPLQRTAAISSTTNLPFTFSRRFQANEPIQFLVHADEHGSFDAAIAHIFADGLAALAGSVPRYWSCYAAAYFVDGPISATAAQDVQHCAEGQAKGIATGSSEAPAVLQSVPVRPTRAAAELGLHGTSIVYTTITAHVVPTQYQILSPIGAGVDELVLQAVSQFKFQAATRDGQPVAAGFRLSIALQ